MHLALGQSCGLLDLARFDDASSENVGLYEHRKDLLLLGQAVCGVDASCAASQQYQGRDREKHTLAPYARHAEDGQQNSILVRLFVRVVDCSAKEKSSKTFARSKVA